MARVEGRTITRRELTYFWLSIDRQANIMLGDMLSERWRAAKGSLPAYTLSEAAIYTQLYSQNIAGGKEPAYGKVLSTMVTYRLVEIEATRKHVVVTPEEARSAAHEMFDQLRKQQNLDISDDQIMTQFHIPRDIFMQDMLFRLRIDHLLAADIARRNGHPLTAEDRANWQQTVAKEKPAYLTRLLHSAHITSVVPLPTPESAAPAQGGPVEVPPPPPDIKQ
jgi:hypothetical protein